MYVELRTNTYLSCTFTSFWSIPAIHEVPETIPGSVKLPDCLTYEGKYNSEKRKKMHSNLMTHQGDNLSAPDPHPPRPLLPDTVSVQQRVTTSVWFAFVGCCEINTCFFFSLNIFWSFCIFLNRSSWIWLPPVYSRFGRVLHHCRELRVSTLFFSVFWHS